MFSINRLFVACVFLFALGCGDELTVEDPPTHAGLKVDMNQYPDVPNSIYGAWTGPTIGAGEGMTIVPQVFLNNRGKVAFSMVCSMPDSLVLHSTLEEYLVTNRVELPIAKEGIYTHTNGSTCSVRVEAGITRFYYSSGKLVVEHDEHGSVEYSRIRF